MNVTTLDTSRPDNMKPDTSGRDSTTHDNTKPYITTQDLISLHKTTKTITTKPNQMKDQNIKTRLMEITPKWAERKLSELQELTDQGTFRQRAVSKASVESIATDIINGKFVTTHQGIAFDEHGRLVDGQKRLWAIVKTGISVKMMVTTGLPAGTNGRLNMPIMDFIDRGQPRSIGTQLMVAHGIKGANQVAAAVRGIGIVYTSNPRIKLTVSQVVEIVSMYERDIQGIFNLIGHAKQRIGALVAPMAVYRNSHPEQAMEFARGFFSKENLQSGSPILGLIKWIELHPGFSSFENMFQKVKATAYCIHQFHTGQPAEMNAPKDEALYWLAALNRKHGEIIRKMINPRA